MSKKTLGTISIVIGLIIIIATLLMGFLGYPNFGFGWKKITMGSFGLIVAIIGFVLVTQKSNTPD